MILTDISGKIKGIPDISPKIFAILAIFLILSGGYLGAAILKREYAREGSLRVISTPMLAASPEFASLPEEATSKGEYVASRSGSFYYLPSCSSAKRIKEKNQVWFASKEDAEARGLKPASNCSGM